MYVCSNGLKDDRRAHLLQRVANLQFYRHSALEAVKEQLRQVQDSITKKEH